MTYRGTVKNGVVVFDGDIKPPEGIIVDVNQVEQDVSAATDGSIWDDLKELEGTAQDLPTDMADNHDHYLHGTEKRVRE